MVVHAGPVWREGRARVGWVDVREGRIVDEGSGRPIGPFRPALLLDGLANLHTHVGDAFLRGEDLPRDLASLVAPGTGIKHRRLAAADPARLRDAMRGYLAEAAALGVSWIVDFREQGRPGIEALREAERGARGPKVFVLGRPTGPSDAAQVLAAADGFGLSSLIDLGRQECVRLAGLAHAADKPLALHASEGTHEPIEPVLALGPDLLVHLSSAPRADLRLVADAGVPVTICPSSNEFFGLRAPVAALHDVGASWYLGTDNAMLGHVDPLVEVARVRITSPTVPDDEFARALTTPPWKAINRLRPDAESRPLRMRVVPLASDGTARWDSEPLVGVR